MMQWGFNGSPLGLPLALPAAATLHRDHHVCPLPTHVDVAATKLTPIPEPLPPDSSGTPIAIWVAVSNVHVPVPPGGRHGPHPVGHCECEWPPEALLLAFQEAAAGLRRSLNRQGDSGYAASSGIPSATSGITSAANADMGTPSPHQRLLQCIGELNGVHTAPEK